MPVCTFIDEQIWGIEIVDRNLEYSSIHICIFRHLNLIVTALIELVVTLLYHNLISFESLSFCSCYETFRCSIAYLISHTWPIAEVQWLTLRFLIAICARNCSCFCAVRIFIEASCVSWTAPTIAFVGIVSAAVFILHITKVVAFLVKVHANSDKLSIRRARPRPLIENHIVRDSICALQFSHWVLCDSNPRKSKKYDCQKVW